jgi:molybdopterin synthase catalytic subunit
VFPLEIVVRYFAAHRELAGVTEERLSIPEGTTVAQLVDRIIGLHPNLEGLRRDTVVSVNRGVGTSDIVLREGDDVALFPPIQGG